MLFATAHTKNTRLASAPNGISASGQSFRLYFHRWYGSQRGRTLRDHNRLDCSDRGRREDWADFRGNGHRDTRLNPGSGYLLIDADILLHHCPGRKVLLDVSAHHRPVKPANFFHILDHLSEIMHKKTALAMNDNFRSGSAGIGDHRTSHGHRLDHYHAKRLFPFNRVEQATRAT